MDDTPTDLFSQQAQNRRRSFWLVVAFVLFFAWLGFGGDWILWQFSLDAPEGAYRHAFPWMGMALTGVALVGAAVAWTRGAERVLWSANAREIIDAQTEDEQRLVNVVEEMAIASGLPRPRIWIVPDDDPNAFATGRDERTSHVAVTQGLLAMLDRDELQAVIAHEMGHVKNLDVRLMTLLAALVGAVALVSDGMWRMLRGGGRRGRVAGFGGIKLGGGRGGKKGGNPLILVVLALWILSWLLAPLVTRLLALGVSRRREYLADAMAAQFTRNPLALAGALHKIEHAAAPTSSIKRGSAHLCIADPLGRKANLRQGFLADLFGTHPPMAIRVARLKAMGYNKGDREGRRDEAEFSATG
ncbi:MAG TPA: M48 family metallopeptidase [Gemmatimonadaceae bacterium]|nr:M48 family metallopeptidase [Gemmatimonadaceae bacterium]